MVLAILNSSYSGFFSNSSAVPKTIFAFLMLNTMSPTHNKIFGAKFLSFERAGINGLNTVDLVVGEWNVQKMKAPKSHFLLQ